METVVLDINKVKTDPNQPRKTFIGIEELAKNIMLEGQIHPIEVDKNFVIVVGERRFRAMKSLGIKEIRVSINLDKMTPYERLRRQMSENLMQSAAKNGDSMPPLDTARGWVKLYELKFHKTYEPGSQVIRNKATGQWDLGPFKEIADEIGAEKHTVWELIKLLDEPQIVQKAIEQGTPRTYFREANQASKKVRQQIKNKILKGEYKNREEISKDVELSKKLPDLAYIELHRNKAKENTKVNGILNGVSYLALALEKIDLSEINDKEKHLVKQQLEWMSNQIESYLQTEEILEEIITTSTNKKQEIMKNHFNDHVIKLVDILGKVDLSKVISTNQKPMLKNCEELIRRLELVIKASSNLIISGEEVDEE